MGKLPKMNPIPMLKTKAEWIERTAAAKERLVVEHRYDPRDFVVVDAALAREGISMSAHGFYPRSWSDWYSTGSGWVRRHPVGLTLYWPSGTDYWGEGHDAKDPIEILAEVEYWSSLTNEDIEASLAA